MCWGRPPGLTRFRQTGQESRGVWRIGCPAAETILGISLIDGERLLTLLADPPNQD